MNNFDVYKDIATRTNGDIYIGVVGPVRTGKSTFISKILNQLVIPNIQDVNEKERTIDEMPQSGDGKNIMTTQPKFIPNEGVKIELSNDVKMKVRLVDCVGYMVEGASGHLNDGKPRQVKTPWSEEGMSFEEAAELGTNKVISNHSTIGIMVTCDGSFTDIPRSNYEKTEKRVIKALEDCKKPYVIILNSAHPENPETKALGETLQSTYGVKVLTLDVNNIKLSDVNNIFAEVLKEFPIVSVDVACPKWLQALPYNSQIIEEIRNEVLSKLDLTEKIGDLNMEKDMFTESENFEKTNSKSIIMGEGKIVLNITPKENLFYKVLSEDCGSEIGDDFHLMSYVKQLAKAKVQYDKFKDAIEQVKETGYGVVKPNIEDLVLEEPKVIKQGGKFGVKLRASAPSLHIMQIDINTELNPVVGTEQQTEDLVKELATQFENDPQSLWQTKMFGKNLNDLVNEGLQNKITNMPVEAQKKMRRTLTRIVNDGKGGVICILL